MKIRTIVGILLVFALVLGSTGVAIADGNEGTGDTTLVSTAINGWGGDGDCIPDLYEKYQHQGPSP
jgi:hypothetical protein